METKYSIYRVGQSEPEHGSVNWPYKPGYKRIKALVEPILGDGEPLEHVSVLFDGERHDMFVSELGNCALTTRPPLPINDAATEIYHAAYKRRYPGAHSSEMPPIAGTAVLFHRIVWM